MDKKLYIQPQTEMSNAIFTQICVASTGVNGVVDGEDGPGYGGIANGQEPEVKGESWTDIWD